LDDIEQVVVIVGMESQRGMRFRTGMPAAQLFEHDAILMGIHGFTSVWPEVERCIVPLRETAIKLLVPA
jgi:hypothetical protein